MKIILLTSLLLSLPETTLCEPKKISHPNKKALFLGGCATTLGLSCLWYYLSGENPSCKKTNVETDALILEFACPSQNFPDHLFKDMPMGAACYNKFKQHNQPLQIAPFWKVYGDSSQDIDLTPKTDALGELNQCFSNWFPSEITAHIEFGIQLSDNSKAVTKFPTAEHFIMLRKVQCTMQHYLDKNDDKGYKNSLDALDKIFMAKSPNEAKKIARNISVDNHYWPKYRNDVAKEVIYEKLSQNPKIQDFLIKTGNAILVEASPFDDIWGIGLKQKDKNLPNPCKWGKWEKGLMHWRLKSHAHNILGEALMNARHELSEEGGGQLKKPIISYPWHNASTYV